MTDSSPERIAQIRQRLEAATDHLAHLHPEDIRAMQNHAPTDLAFLLSDRERAAKIAEKWRCPNCGKSVLTQTDLDAQRSRARDRLRERAIRRPTDTGDAK